MLIAIVVVVVLVLVAVALYVEIYFYEGVHLGSWVQARLYDQWADRYDQDKAESQRHDADLLVRPLRQALAGVPEPFVLDVATGTGRLPDALLCEPGFAGRIVALDISEGMLACAASKLAAHGDRVALMQHGALGLPFPDNTFDAVSCLEALELMAGVEEPLAELARVLRPGGVLLTSRGCEASGRVGQVHSRETFETLLHDSGFERVEILPWWKMFDRVWARKPGQSPVAGPRSLADVLSCPACGELALGAGQPGALRCGRCGAGVPISPEGIVLYGSKVRR